MAFWLAFFVVTISCIAISFKTLAGYHGFSLAVRLLILTGLILSWFGPFIWRALHNAGVVSGAAYAIGAKLTYFLFGMVFILVVLLLVREVVWYALYYITRRPTWSPDNTRLLAYLNVITITVALLISLYALWEANKTPNIRKYDIVSDKIRQDTRVVAASDLHIDQATPLWRIKRIVDIINAQNPDYVLLVGDLIDDVPEKLKGKIEELQKIKAKKVYLSLGNHEYYNRPALWMIEFTKLGFEVLHNTGESMGESGIFLGGIPDAHSASINLGNTLYGSDENQYKILISHAPYVVNQLEPGMFDLQISGHTHGGQIFPFHILVQQANHYLQGMYEVNGMQLYITRGAGYWGPPMRLLAPSDITVFDFRGGQNG